MTIKTILNFIHKSKNLTKGLEATVLAISENSNLYNLLRKLNKYKYNIVNVISDKGKIIKNLTEEEINNILIKNPLSFSIKDTMK